MLAMGKHKLNMYCLPAVPLVVDRLTLKENSMGQEMLGLYTIAHTSTKTISSVIVYSVLSRPTTATEKSMVYARYIAYLLKCSNITKNF